MEQKKHIAIIVMLFLMLQSSSSNGMHFFNEGFHTAKEWWDNAEGLTKAGILLVGAFAGYVFLTEYRISRLKRESEKNKLVIGAIAYGGFDTCYNAILETIQADQEQSFDNIKGLFEGNSGVGDCYKDTYDFLTGQITSKMQESLFDYPKSPGDVLKDEIKHIAKKIGGHGIKLRSARVQVTTLNRTLFGDDYKFYLPDKDDLQQRQDFYASHRKKAVEILLDSCRTYAKSNEALNPFDHSPTIIRRIVEPPGNREKEKEN